MSENLKVPIEVLPSPERAVLEAVAARREATAEAVAGDLAMQPPDVEAALARLVALDYAIEETTEGRKVFRAAAGVLEEP